MKQHGDNWLLKCLNKIQVENKEQDAKEEEKLGNKNEDSYNKRVK